MKKTLFLLFMGLCPLWLGAQTAQWMLKPQYSSITPYNEDLLKVKLYNKVGLVDREGNEVVAVSADSITPMAEGLGLVLQIEEELFRLTGIVTQAAKMLPVTEEVYVKEYPFFSEGKLPVCNKKGTYGFMDVTGRLVLKFEYGTIHPFSEGWASVSNSKSVVKQIGGFIGIGSKRPKMYYVNERGQTLTLQSDIGDVYSATTFKDGEALVVTKDNDYYIINTAGNIIRKESNVAMKFDKKYALCQTEEETEEEEAFSEIYDGPTAFTNETGLYGYKQGGKVILPNQFLKAYSFSNGCAIAKRNDFWGVLKLMNGTLQCKATQGASKDETNYVVTMPDGWKGGRLLLYDMTDGEKKTYTGKMNGQSSYEFPVTLPKGKRKLYVGSDNLLLWSNELQVAAPSSSSSADISVQFSSSSVKANAKDMATVNVVVRNNGGETREVTVQVTGDRLWAAEKTLTLKSGEQGIVPASFYKIAFKEQRTINVKVSGMEKTITKKIEVNPFYEDF